jgi:hypothetical protein
LPAASTNPRSYLLYSIVVSYCERGEQIVTHEFDPIFARL